VQELIWLFIAIIPHELGHYLGYRWFGQKPKIRFTRYGVIMIGEKVQLELNSYQRTVVAEMGIIFGYLFLDFMNVSNNIILTYLIMCLFDIYIVFEIFQMKKEWRKLKVKDVQILQAKQILAEYKGDIQ